MSEVRSQATDGKNESGADESEKRKVLNNGHRKIQFPFRKFKRSFFARRKDNIGLSSSGKKVGVGNFNLCFMRPRTLDSHDESATAEPKNEDNEEFTYEFLKVLIETNDFYSKECNTHN